MAFNIKYQLLCDVQLWHGYLLNKDGAFFVEMSEEDQMTQLAKVDISTIFKVIPTKETQQRLKNNHIVFRNTSTGFKLFVKVKEGDNKPFIDWSSHISLDFVVLANSPYVGNFTNLPFRQDEQSHIYLLGNTMGAKVGDKLFLSQEIEAYDGDFEYVTSDLVKLNDAELREAIFDDPKNPASQPDEWQEVPFSAYVSQQDRRQMQGTSFRLNFPNAGTTQATLKLLNLANEEASLEEVLEKEEQAPLGNFFVEIPNAPEGMYFMDVLEGNTRIESLSKEVLISNELAGQQVFAAINISHAPSKLADFALLKDDGTFLDEVPVFVAHFKNRDAFWRYIYNEAPLNNDADIDPAYEKETADFKQFVTKAPKPLLLAPQATKVVAAANGPNLPNPEVRLIKPDGDGKIFSETYIYI